MCWVRDTPSVLCGSTGAPNRTICADMYRHGRPIHARRFGDMGLFNPSADVSFVAVRHS
jgi:hypothetical protein